MINKNVMKSVFIRLIAVEIVLIVLIEVLVGLVYNHYVEKGIKLRRNVYSYALKSAIAEMGLPPELARAQGISKQIGIPFRYESHEVTWTTDERFPAVNQIAFKSSESAGPIHGTYEGEYFSAIKYGDGMLMWKREAFAPRTISLFLGGLVINAFLLLAIASVLSSLIIMRILRPVMWVAEGVKRLGGGNLSYRILENRKRKSGRFRDLIKSFDGMADRMGRMLEARERLLLDMSHELRTPLTRMKVALELLPKSKETDSIREDAVEMEKMILQILETARQRDDHSQLKCISTDIISLILEVKDFYKKQSVDVSVEFAPGSLILNIDPERIKSVLKNVIENAIKYSDDNGKPVKILLRLSDEHVVIQIKDSGIGIPPEELPLVFEPFYRVDKSRSKRSGGYGLGLSLCKTIMEAHNGKIEIESVEGKGTTVSLLFPL